MKPKKMFLSQFTKKYNLYVYTDERNQNLIDAGCERFYAAIESLHIKEPDGSLIGCVCGGGNTPKEALDDMCKEYSNKVLEIWDYTPDGDFNVLHLINPLTLIRG